MLKISLEYAILSKLCLHQGGVFILWRDANEISMTAIGVSLDPKTIRELSDLSEALDRSVSEIAREMILSDIATLQRPTSASNT